MDRITLKSVYQRQDSLAYSQDRIGAVDGADHGSATAIALELAASQSGTVGQCIESARRLLEESFGNVERNERAARLRGSAHVA